MVSVASTPMSLTRVFTDADGVEWQVCEMDGSAVPAGRGSRCLVFRSSQVIRRVWSYPRDWVELSPAELAEVSWNR